MRGYPFVESLILGLVLACLAFPLHWVTRDKAPLEISTSAAEQDSGSAHLVSADLILRSAHPYESVTITLEEQNFSLTADENELSLEIDPHTKIEITVSATWPDGTPETALLIELSPSWHEAISHTIWGEGTAYETLVFSWEGDGHE